MWDSQSDGHRELKCPFLLKAERMGGREGITQGENCGREEPRLFPARGDNGRNVKDKITDACFLPHSRAAGVNVLVWRAP